MKEEKGGAAGLERNQFAFQLGNVSFSPLAAAWCEAEAASMARLAWSTPSTTEQAGPHTLHAAPAMVDLKRRTETALP